MKFIFTTILSLLLFNVCISQTEEPCPVEGRSPSDIAKRMNVLKNRDITNGVANPNIVADSILKGGPEDTGKYKNSDYATVTGYVLGADDAGPESCNCFSNDTNKQNIKIYIGQNLSSWKDSVFVVEITPPFKKLHREINADGLIGLKITVTGKMMYNFEAKKFALNACSKCRTTDRKTAWEICPVTDIQVTPTPVPATIPAKPK